MILKFLSFFAVTHSLILTIASVEINLYYLSDHIFSFQFDLLNEQEIPNSSNVSIVSLQDLNPALYQLLLERLLLLKLNKIE